MKDAKLKPYLYWHSDIKMTAASSHTLLHPGHLILVVLRILVHTYPGAARLTLFSGFYFIFLIIGSCRGWWFFSDRRGVRLFGRLFVTLGSRMDWLIWFTLKRTFILKLRKSSTKKITRTIESIPNTCCIIKLTICCLQKVRKNTCVKQLKLIVYLKPSIPT